MGDYRNYFQKYNEEIFNPIRDLCTESRRMGQYYVLGSNNELVFVYNRLGTIIISDEDTYTSKNTIEFHDDSFGKRIQTHLRKKYVGSYNKPTAVFRSTSTKGESEDFIRIGNSVQGVNFEDDKDPIAEMIELNKHESFAKFYDNLKRIIEINKEQNQQGKKADASTLSKIIAKKEQELASLKNQLASYKNSNRQNKEYNSPEEQ